MENEMPQLSSAGAELVALDRNRRSGAARTLVDAEISLERSRRRFMQANRIGNGLGKTANGQQWPGMDSDFRLVIVAALRTKQLLHGATARVDPHPLRRRNTSIALEEIKRGLVHFTTRSPEEMLSGNAE
jgi:DNA-directed RNA polymerase omega subunit